jgi:hypothetical protein
MKLSGFAALALLASTVGLTGSYVAGLGDRGDGVETGGTPALSKGALLTPLRRAVPDDGEVASVTVANAAVVDASLLSPYPMAPSAAPARQAPPSDPEPFQTAAIRSNQTMTQLSGTPAAAPSAPGLAETRKALVEPRLEDGILTVTQIARIKARLHLTPDQERHWGAVENELREISRQLATQKASGKKPKIALSAVDAQRLYWAAGPLIMSLREDQKQEVRRLARAMGLEQVASLI